VALLAARRGGPDIRLQALLYPVTTPDQRQGHRPRGSEDASKGRIGDSTSSGSSRHVEEWFG
jgi:hypothetical protein